MFGTGVYEHTAGEFLGGHAVKIIGWGVDAKSKKDYWLIANSWNPSWCVICAMHLRKDCIACCCAPRLFLM